MKSKVKIIDKTFLVNCYICDGKGCVRCDNTGKWEKGTSYLVATQPDGTKIAFQVDQAGK